MVSVHFVRFRTGFWNLDVRRQAFGRGLWIGLVLDTPARPYCEALAEEGLLCKETHGNVIRIAPPLVITKKEIDWAFERIEKVVTAL